MVIESTLWALSIQQKFQFESLEIPNGTCNGTFGTFWLLFLQAGYKRAEQFCHNIMERDISVWPTKMTWPIKVDYRGHHLFLSPGWQLWSPLLKMAGKLSTPPPLLFFQGGIWKIVVNLQSEIFIPKWAVIISDHAGSLALQWITGWNNTIWADST